MYKIIKFCVLQFFFIIIERKGMGFFDLEIFDLFDFFFQKFISL